MADKKQTNEPEKKEATAESKSANAETSQSKKPAEKARETALDKAASGKSQKAASAKTKKGGKAGKVKSTKSAPQTTATNRPDKGASTANDQSRNNSIFSNMENLMTNSYQFDKLAQEAQNNGKESLEAFAQTSTLLAKGAQDFMKTYISWAQESAEKNSQAFKTLLGCKTLNELTEAQSRLAQENFDDFLSGVTKLSELSVKVTTDALEPINDQVSKTVRKASDSAAA